MRVGPVTCFDTLTGPKKDFAIPTLDELGLPAPTTSIRGGETLGRARLAAFNNDEKGKRAALFEKPQTSPAVPGPLCEPKRAGGSRSQGDDEGSSEDVDVSKPSTTLLSPYLKFGCVGVRECWWSWSDILSNAPKSAKKPENLLGQLEFRDMYYAAELAVGGTKFGRVRGNPISKYIPWHCPTVYSENGEPIIPRPKDKEHPHAEEWLAAWGEGRTGFPWIDALMRQLREEGWIHHLGRHSVACFLTRGQCYVSWERGAEVFDEHLIDWDPASNYGNWMWLSCSAFQSQFLRVYGVASWPAKFDKTGALVRKYIPELQNFPDKYIYEPWLAPDKVQKEAGCIIGKDYPEPMLDEKAEKNRNLRRMKAAYKAGLHGDAPEVLHGTASDLIEDLIEEAEGDINTTKRKGTDDLSKKRARARGGESQGNTLDKYMRRK
ncbi:hypothetical protein FRC06_004035 [Ceratobasidium sp. 370]|nr:hypothetical protein FRC06_004035 [Ceratobasidium sp. 370]